MMTWEEAICSLPIVGIRKRNKGYEVALSSKCENIYLGTYRSYEDARDSVVNYRLNNFLTKAINLGLDANSGRLVYEKYIAFPSGEILNLFGREMIGSVDRCGYNEVILNHHLYRRHRIIAEVFVPNPNNKPCVNHKDGNKLNNRADNLEWVTHSENTLHAFKTGLESIRTKLKPEDILFIRENYKRRDPVFGCKALAKRFSVDVSTISDIVNNKSHRRTE